jgi:osmotically-inducible protein OsmY
MEAGQTKKGSRYRWSHEKLLALVLPLLFLSACAGMQKSERRQGLPPEEAVKERIALDSRLSGSSLSVDLEGGTATLSGTVRSLGEKLVAQEDLQEVNGVRKVVNNLEVKPSSIPDTEIADSILAAVPSHCLVETEGITVAVKSGDVTLKGRSKSLHHKDVIMNIALFTRGVRFVDNQIEVIPELSKGNQSDVRIKKNVEGVIYSMPIKTQSILVKVENGEVTLSGDTNSYLESKNIEKAVRNVPGVERVKNKINYNRGYLNPKVFIF